MVCFVIGLIGLQRDGFLLLGIASFDSSNLDVQNIQILVRTALIALRHCFEKIVALLSESSYAPGEQVSP